MGRSSSENTGLRTVSMNEIRLIRLECSFDGEVSARVMPRMKASLKFRQDANVQATLLSSLFEGSLRPDTRTGNQANFIAMQVVLIVHIEQGVFLSPANDEPGDDVGNSHKDLITAR